MKLVFRSLVDLLLCFTLIGVTAGYGQVWPKGQGVYVAKSSPAIPAFPAKLPEFRAAGKGKDFWGKHYDTEGSIRIFEGNDWEELYQFPNTMNHCSEGVWMLRWRSANAAVRVSTRIANNNYAQGMTPSKTGTYGYMYGTNCEQPYFKFAGVTRGNESNLVDIYYEIKFWTAAP